jgi:hypothetical protein
VVVYDDENEEATMGRKERLIADLNRVLNKDDLPLKARLAGRNAMMTLLDTVSIAEEIRASVLTDDSLSEEILHVFEEAAIVLENRASWAMMQEAAR